jgi:hypothetical protein
LNDQYDPGKTEIAKNRTSRSRSCTIHGVYWDIEFPPTPHLPKQA